MDEELFYKRVDNIVNRGSIRDILNLWKESVSMGSTGTIVRHLITDKVPDISEPLRVENRRRSFLSKPR